MINKGKGASMADIMIKTIMGTVLLACGVQDLLKKKIYLWAVGLGAILIIFCLPFCHNNSVLERVGGLAVGIIVIIISFATEGKIGMGDGMLLCITGIGLGFWGNLELFAIALSLAAFLSVILLITRHADRKKAIPFVPFLLFAYVFLIAAGN
jgi:leader peptidase (prepilin peptidase)/N-methyltransferase